MGGRGGVVNVHSLGMHILKSHQKLDSSITMVFSIFLKSEV